MENNLYLIKCPKCGNKMKYQENLNSPHKKYELSKKSKRCVYCGKNFKVLGHILRHAYPIETQQYQPSKNPFSAQTFINGCKH